MQTAELTELEKTARRRYLHQAQSVWACGAFIRREVNYSTESWGPDQSECAADRDARNTEAWGPDWSAPHRIVPAQIELAKHLNENLPPEAIATLNTPKPIGPDHFRRQIERLRLQSAKLHRSPCPPRHRRKIEYIAALEYGFNPRKAEPGTKSVTGKEAATGRLHAHVLLYNLGGIRLEDLAQRWRELNCIKNVKEPHIRQYTRGPEGILYCLKSYGSDVDLIHFSPRLHRLIAW